MFTQRISLPPLCRGLGGLEGGSSQRSLQRNGTIRKTFSSGMAAVRRHSQSIAVKLQAVSRGRASPHTGCYLLVTRPLCLRPRRMRW